MGIVISNSLLKWLYFCSHCIQQQAYKQLFDIQCKLKLIDFALRSFLCSFSFPGVSFSHQFSLYLFSSFSSKAAMSSLKREAFNSFWIGRKSCHISSPLFVKLSELFPCSEKFRAVSFLNFVQKLHLQDSWYIRSLFRAHRLQTILVKLSEPRKNRYDLCFDPLRRRFP